MNMPSYSFQCECGVQFNAAVSIKKATEPYPCPECKKLAPREVPKDVSGIFNQPVTGPGPQNSGIASLDAHIDRVIGTSAQQSMVHVEARRREKLKVLAETGASPDALSRNPDGSYRVMTPEERGVSDRAIRLNDAASKALVPALAKKEASQ
jgi:hypothetical protein